MTPTSIQLLNTLLSLAVLVFSYMYYKKEKSTLLLFLTISFVLFFSTNVIILFGLAEKLLALTIIVRVVAYGILIFYLAPKALKK